MCCKDDFEKSSKMKGRMFEVSNYIQVHLYVNTKLRIGLCYISKLDTLNDTLNPTSSKILYCNFFHCKYQKRAERCACTSNQASARHSSVLDARLFSQVNSFLLTAALTALTLSFLVLNLLLAPQGFSGFRTVVTPHLL